MIVLIVTEMDEVRSDNELIYLIASIYLLVYTVVYTVYMAMQHFFSISLWQPKTNELLN